jgi:hypothetical protein
MLMVGPGVGDGLTTDAEGPAGEANGADPEAEAAEAAAEPDADAIGDPHPIATTATTTSTAQAMSGGVLRWWRGVLDRVIESPSGGDGVRAW